MHLICVSAYFQTLIMMPLIQTFLYKNMHFQNFLFSYNFTILKITLDYTFKVNILSHGKRPKNSYISHRFGDSFPRVLK